MIKLIMTQTHSVVQTAIATYVNMLPKTAEKDIKIAEKMMADYQKTRMASKSTSGSSKADNALKTSSPFNAFLVGSTFYSTSDAAMRAHSLHAKTVEKKIFGSLLLQLVLFISYNLITRQFVRIPIGMAITCIAIFMDVKDQKALSWVLGAISASNLLSTGIKMIISAIVHLEVIPSRINKLCMSWLAYLAVLSDMI